MPIITASGPETLVNTTTTESQIVPITTPLANGRYIVTWTDNVQYGLSGAAAQFGGTEIRAQIFNADGTLFGSEFLVNTTTAGAQIRPAVTSLSDGNFIIVWQDGLGAHNGQFATTRAREFTATGAAVGSEFQIGTAGVEVIYPQLTALAGGGYVATWQAGRLGNVIAQVYDSNNAAVGGQIVVDNTQLAQFAAPQITTLTNGNFVIAWNNGAGAASAASYQIYTPAGALVGSQSEVFAAGSTVGAITALTSGGFAIAHQVTLPPHTEIYISYYFPDGTFGTFNVAGIDPARPITNMDIAPLLNGGAIISWMQADPATGDGNNTSIRAAAFNAVGNLMGQEFQVNTSVASTQANPSISVLADGDIVIVWNDLSGAPGDTSGYAIRSQRYNYDPANQNPDANDDSIIAFAGETLNAEDYLTFNDVDLDGDVLLVTEITNVTGGTVNFNAATQQFEIAYANGSTAVRFNYAIDDGFGGTSSAQATLFQTRDDVVTIRGGTTTSIAFLANDYLAERPESYGFTFQYFPGPPVNFMSYTPVLSGAATTMRATLSYDAGGQGYAWLPLGQSQSLAIIYNVFNPVTGAFEYSATMNVTLQGWAQVGSTAFDYLVGGAQADHLAGGSGAANILQGGAGDDWYTVTAAGDSVIENANEGTDTVFTTLSVMTIGTNIENLTYTGTVSFLGLGNAANNNILGRTARDELYGFDGNDILQGGGGGDGQENTMFGGLGDDRYVVNVRGDSTIEYAGEGIDTVSTQFSVYGLQANIENLSFIDTAAHGAGVGNELDNIITGNIGADGLYGRAGNDTLRGGLGVANTLLGQEGDDIYVVSAAGDSVIEFAGEGTDTVQTALASFVLRDNVENLTYTGTAAFTGIGAADGNTITGGGADDFLSGLDGADILIGGNSADLLLGGNGADQFRFLGGETGIDRILDFTSGADKIALLGSFFTPTGTVSFAQGAGAVATTANSSFIYDTATGALFYDDDGTGAGAAVQLATLNAGLTLAAGDFIFV